MPITIGTHGLIEDPVVWKIAAGADSYAGPFVLSDADGNPIDLTGYTAACQIRPRAGGPLMADLSSGENEIVIDGLAGSVLVHCPAAVSATWAPSVRKGEFDIELTSPAGIIQRLCTGTNVISPNITTEASA